MGDSETTGPPLPENLAALTDKILKRRPTDEKEKSLLKYLLRPGNSEQLKNPHINLRSGGNADRTLEPMT